MANVVYTMPLATTWKLADNILGVADLAAVYTAGVIGAPGITPLPSAVIEQQLGSIVTGVSYDTTYGGMAKFIFLAVPTTTTVTQGLLYKWKGSDYSIEVMATSVASGAQSGIPVALALNSVTSNTTTVQYTWFMVQGRGAVLKGGALSIAPNLPLFVSNLTAGRVRGTASIVRALIGMRSANAASATSSVLPVYLEFPSIAPGA